MEQPIGRKDWHVTMRLYHMTDRKGAKSILTAGFCDSDYWTNDDGLILPEILKRQLIEILREQGRTAISTPILRGVLLIDDPTACQGCGADTILRVEVRATEDMLSPFERLGPGIPWPFGMHDTLREDGWRKTRLPFVGASLREWVVPAAWLGDHASKTEIVTDRDGIELWKTVARDRRPRPDAPVRDAIDVRLGVLMRTLHTRRTVGVLEDMVFEEPRVPLGTTKASDALRHFDLLVANLTRLNVPLDRCGPLLAEAARRLVIDTHRLASVVRQKRAAQAKSDSAWARDDPNMVAEARRLAEAGVSVAKLRRLLIAKFRGRHVPSETVIRRRWLKLNRFDLLLDLATRGKSNPTEP